MFRPKNSFLKVLAHYVQTSSASHADNLNGRFRELSRFTHSNCGVVSQITSYDVVNYRATLDREHEWYLGALRGFFKTWVELGYSGIDENLLSLLEGWRLKGNVKGRAVKTLCPVEGPLSDFEFSALHQSLTDAFEAGNIGLDAFTLVQPVVEKLRLKAAQEIGEDTAGADRWYQIHDLTEKRLRDLVDIMKDPNIQNGAIIKLRNKNEFSPLRRALSSKTKQSEENNHEGPLKDLKHLFGGGLG